VKLTWVPALMDMLKVVASPRFVGLSLRKTNPAMGWSKVETMVATVSIDAVGCGHDCGIDA
jgi:hypothetical protein